MSPTTNTSGWPGNEQSGFTLMRPERSHCAPVASASIFARGEAKTPAAQIFVFAEKCCTDPFGPLDIDSVRVEVRNDRIDVDLDADLLQLAGRFPGEPVAEGGQDLWAAFEQEHSHFARIESPEIVFKCPPRQLRDLACDLDAGRATTDDGEREPCPTNLRIALQLGHLECAEYPCPLIECVRERFHSGRPLRVLVVSEVRLPDSRSDD